MTSPTEICENCGYKEDEHEWCSLCKVYHVPVGSCNKFTPKKESFIIVPRCQGKTPNPKNTQQDKTHGTSSILDNRSNSVVVTDKTVDKAELCKIPQNEEFTNVCSFDKYEGVSSAENCEICKDYPKEYWCGNSAENNHTHGKVSRTQSDGSAELLDSDRNITRETNNQDEKIFIKKIIREINRNSELEDENCFYSIKDLVKAISLARAEERQKMLGIIDKEIADEERGKMDLVKIHALQGLKQKLEMGK